MITRRRSRLLSSSSGSPPKRPHQVLKQAEHGPAECGQNISIPPDLYKDFEALKSASNMDTADLMRKLLNDYQRLAVENSNQPKNAYMETNDIPVKATEPSDSKRTESESKSFGKDVMGDNDVNYGKETSSSGDTHVKNNGMELVIVDVKSTGEEDNDFFDTEVKYDVCNEYSDKQVTITKSGNVDSYCVDKKLSTHTGEADLCHKEMHGCGEKSVTVDVKSIFLNVNSCSTDERLADRKPIICDMKSGDEVDRLVIVDVKSAADEDVDYPNIENDAEKKNFIDESIDVKHECPMMIDRGLLCRDGSAFVNKNVCSLSTFDKNQTLDESSQKCQRFTEDRCSEEEEINVPLDLSIVKTEPILLDESFNCFSVGKERIHPKSEVKTKLEPPAVSDNKFINTGTTPRFTEANVKTELPKTSPVSPETRNEVTTTTTTTIGFSGSMSIKSGLEMQSSASCANTLTSTVLTSSSEAEQSTATPFLCSAPSNLSLITSLPCTNIGLVCSSPTTTTGGNMLAMQKTENYMYMYPVGVPTLTQIPVSIQTGMPNLLPSGASVQNKIVPPPKNELKLVTENNIFPGVYTSILKLSSHKRTRSKPGRAKKIPQPKPPVSSAATAHPIVFIPSVGPIQKICAPSIPPSTSGYLNPAVTSAVSSSLTGKPQDVPTGINIQTSSLQTVTSQQSVMMVYPHAAMNRNGKPVRRRGRPPKLPMLAQLLTEKKTNKFLNVNSIKAEKSDAAEKLCKTENKMNLKNSLLFNTCEKKSSEDKHINESTQETGSSEVYKGVSLNKGKEIITSKDNSGAMYQEMILSSKSLINIKPRKSHATCDFMKSSSNFICTSFRIRPRAFRSRHNGVGHHGRGKKEGKSIQHRLTKTAGLNEKAASNTDKVKDSSLPSKNLFQELYHCKICNEIVSADEKVHHQRQHVPVKFYCQTCGLEYQSFLARNSDVDSGLTETLQCDRCNSRFTNQNVPLNGCLQVQGGNVLCDLCGEQFHTFTHFYEHRLKIHKDSTIGSEHYVCEVCSKVLYTAKALRYHKKTHLDRTVVCNVENCSRLFHNHTDLLRHIKEQHDKIKEFTCIYDGCNKRFMKNFHLQEHIRVKHFNIRAFCCTWPGCTKEFAAERHLKVHLLIHKDEKPLKCEYCDYRCRQRNALNWHMRKHPEAPYKYRKFSKN